MSYEGKSLPFSEIPLVDFGRFLNGNDKDKVEIAEQIGSACRNVGFFYIKNHGISSDLISRVYEQARRFFSLPIEEKMLIYIGLTSLNRGYTPIYEEKLSLKGDLKEGFDCANELEENDVDRVERGAQLHGPNVWPKNLQGFKECVYDEYYLSVLKLAHRLLKSFALALNLPENYFESITQKPMGTLRLLYYPPQPPIIDPDQLGCGSHTDYECFTLLSQSNEKGLQVQNVLGEWIEAPPIDGTFVVNIGDMMARWTNGVFISTVHRVINTSGRERYSIPFFFGPDYFTKIECLKTCINEKNPPKYAPITAGDYLVSRFNDTYKYRQVEDTL
ncbi:unnamed protein product [Didymodactylos carnosus]|uniref:Fe2OG dioxygenase domain-containing protein n=1 Tax=Didymodactylos carnosus TaxID=1234261 RepID=A0A814LXA4_9BILA|nr:unnamed protein product [Didymodactylos carnosus]CAF1070456.1 unnamed protein product [Didymodactylos carnosus]CAF3803344.1 unnamed protein product [Didymodactylos carnosus]CAF3837599.1 unnamed protein product [Didymodactylos carnosus]